MANRHWVTGGNGNTNSTTNWSDTSGGASGFSVPILGDNVFFDGNSGAGVATVNAALVCTTLNCTGFTGTLVGSSTLTVHGSVTFVAGMTLSYSGTLTISAASTLTSAGITLACNLTLNGSSVVTTLADNVTVTGTVTFSNTAATLNGNTLYLKSLTATAGSSGTTNFVFSTTGGTYSGTGSIGNNITFTTNTTISGTVALNGAGKTLSHTGGTITTTSSTVNISAALNLDVSGITFNNLSVFNGMTLLADLHIGGTFTSTNATNTVNGFTIYTKSLTMTSALSGTTALIFNTTGGVWSGAGLVGIDVTISANITFSGSIVFGGGKTLTRSSGTVTTTGSTFNTSGNCSIDSGTIIFNNYTVTGSGTTTLLADINVTGITTISAAIVFNGYTFYVGGNYTHLTGSTASGTTTLYFNGTTLITHGGGEIRMNIIFAGIISFTSANFNYGNSAGAAVTCQFISGVIANGANIVLSNCILDLPNVQFNNITVNSAFTITLTSALNFTGVYTSQGATVWNGADLIGGSLQQNTGGSISGTSVLRIKYGARLNWSAITNGALLMNVIIDTLEKVSLGNMNLQCPTFTVLQGKITQEINTTVLISSTGTYIGLNKVLFRFVTVTGGITITMSKFFSGSPKYKTRVGSSNTTNFIVSFQDTFERMSKFIKLSNCTVNNKGQLLLLTPGANGNTGSNQNIGVRYINHAPNGMARNSPSIQHETCFGIGSGFLTDPLAILN